MAITVILGGRCSGGEGDSEGVGSESDVSVDGADAGTGVDIEFIDNECVGNDPTAELVEVL
jgi:hypothetical protein